MRKNLLLERFKFERSWTVYLLLFILYIILMPRSGHEGDLRCWQEWIKNDFTGGLSHAYLVRENFSTDYLPLWHYVLYIFGWFQGSIEKIETNLHWIKVVPLFFEFAGGIIFIKIIRARFSNPNDVFFFSLLLFLNASYFYNSIIWGQVDGILATLILLSFYSILKEKVLYSIIFILLALNFKLQAVIFVPMIGLLLLPLLARKFTWRNILAWILIPVFIQALIIMPFALAGDLDRIWYLVMNYAGRYPVISMNAYNMWYWFLGNNLRDVSDQGLFWGLTYKSWGLVLFCFISLAAMFPLLRSSYSRIIMKVPEEFSASKIFLTATIIALIFFFFNTEMHERYSHPAIVFVAIYSALTRNYAPYILVSLAYLLNMEAVLKYLKIHNYETLIFAPQFVAAIYFIAILWLFFDLYKNKYAGKLVTTQQF